MKVAVVGAGFAGLACAFFLSQNKVKVTLFDQKGIGGGASGASTGLLHPYPGKKGVKSWRADEGMEASLELLERAEKSLGRPVFEKSGILRLPDRWIPEGVTVYTRPYLEGLWASCEGAQFVQATIKRPQELEGFDAKILASGSGWGALALKKTIGQALLCRWSKRLPYPLLSDGAHITPTEDPHLCLVGSTYEHTEKPDPQKAYALLEKSALFYPEAKDFEVVEILTGIRASPLVGYRPICEKLSASLWILTGFGSRGLLYHALFAKELINDIVI